MSKRRSIQVVHESDFEDLLKSLGVYEEIASSQKRCGICGQVITIDQISVLYAEEGQIKACCASIECMEKLTGV